MKKFWMMAGSVALLAMACRNTDNQNGSGTLNLSGELKGMDSGYVEFLYPAGDSSKTDSALVKDGKFTYKLELKEPVNIIFRVAGTRGEEVSFFADPGKVTINGYRDSVWASKVVGGPTQALFTKGDESIKAIMKPGEQLYMAYQAAQQTQNMSEMTRIEGEFNRLQDSAKRFTQNFIYANRNSVIAPYYALVYLNEPGKEALMSSIYDTLSPAIQASFFGTKLNELITMAAKTAVGAMAPDFTQNTPAGTPLALSSLKGKYVLVDFWASWCQPCRAENPNIVKAYNAYKDKGFDILGVSLDMEENAWKKAIQDDKLTWNHVSDLKYWENAVAKSYGIRSIPASVLLDKEGRIIAKNLRGPELEAKLAELMP